MLSSLWSAPLPGRWCHSQAVPLPHPLLPQSSPMVVCTSHQVLEEILDLAPEVGQSQEFADWAGGNTVLAGSSPMAHRWLGVCKQESLCSGTEVTSLGAGPDSWGTGGLTCWGSMSTGGHSHLSCTVHRKGERWEIQLKGSGRTPYSR